MHTPASLYRAHGLDAPGHGRTIIDDATRAIRAAAARLFSALRRPRAAGPIAFTVGGLNVARGAPDADLGAWLLQRVARRVATDRRARIAYDRIDELPDYLLRDMGLTRYQVRAARRRLLF